MSWALQNAVPQADYAVEVQGKQFFCLPCGVRFRVGRFYPPCTPTLEAKSSRHRGLWKAPGVQVCSLKAAASYGPGLRKGMAYRLKDLVA